MWLLTWPPIDRQHLARHPLIALVPGSAVFQEAVADLSNGDFVGVRPECAGLHLPFDLNAEGIRRLLA
jgi:hypothetical protein